MEEQHKGFFRRHWLLNTIAIISLYLPFSVFVYKSIQGKLDDFASTIVDVMIANEDIAVFCETKTRAPEWFREYIIFTLRQEIKVGVKNMLKQRANLGRYISYATFRDTSALMCWNGQLLEAGINLCSIKLKSIQKTDVWREALLGSIQEDKEKHQQLYMILWDSANFLFSLFIPREALFEQSYKAPSCAELQKIINQY